MDEAFSSRFRIRSNAIGYMNNEQARWKYPERNRRITYWAEEQQRKSIVFANALYVSKMMVCELCHSRLQIELFLK